MLLLLLLSETTRQNGPVLLEFAQQNLKSKEKNGHFNDGSAPYETFDLKKFATSAERSSSQTKFSFLIKSELGSINSIVSKQV